MTSPDEISAAARALADALNAEVADGPGTYEVTVESRVRVIAGSRRFAQLRAESLIGSAFLAGEPAGDRIVTVRITKHDGPEFGGEQP